MNRNAVAFLMMIVFLAVVVLVGWVFALNSQMQALVEEVDDLSTRLEAAEKRLATGQPAPAESGRGRRSGERRGPPPERSK